MFTRAIGAEFAKIFTVRLWWILLIVLFGYITFIAALLAGVFGALGDLGGSDAPQIPEEVLPPLIYSTASSIGYVFPVLFGALATTAEFHHQTLTPTFLATPKRTRVLAAKFIALAAIGALYGVVALLASMGIGGLVLSAVGIDPQFGETDTWALAGRVLIAMMLWAAIGVGLGTLVKSQVVAIVIVLVFTQFLEPILRLGASLGAGAWEWTAKVGQYLPGAASDALVGSSVFTAMGQSGGPVESLEWWQGGLVLLAYAVIAGAAGYFTTWRKDVT
jgi:ABC-type transport system involved in multi-copper enzyme maturation permease subunit